LSGVSPVRGKKKAAPVSPAGAGRGKKGYDNLREGVTKSQTPRRKGVTQLRKVWEKGLHRARHFVGKTTKKKKVGAVLFDGLFRAKTIKSSGEGIRGLKENVTKKRGRKSSTR